MALPIRKIDFGDVTQRRLHDRIAELVEKMLRLDTELTRDADDMQSSLAHEIAATDREIDCLVYELYELSRDEKATVEEDLVRGH